MEFYSANASGDVGRGAIVRMVGRSIGALSLDFLTVGMLNGTLKASGMGCSDAEAEVAAMRTGHWGVLGVVLLFGVTECGGTTAAAPASLLGSAKSSVVAGLPVPSRAVVVVDKPNELGEYRLPSGVSLASLNEWFDQHLRQNVSRQWVRCRLSHTHGPGAGKIWSWKKDGSLLDIITISIPGPRDGTGSQTAQVRFTEKLEKESLLSCT
jgi:hypothetical protein